MLATVQQSRVSVNYGRCHWVKQHAPLSLCAVVSDRGCSGQSQVLVVDARSILEVVVQLVGASDDHLCKLAVHGPAVIAKGVGRLAVGDLVVPEPDHDALQLSWQFPACDDALRLLP